MQKIVRVYKSHEEAEAADLDYYRKLTPEQRLRILLKIIADHHGSEYAPPSRLQRVCQITQRGRG